MKKSLFSFLVLALALTLFSCEKDGPQTDDELIDAIIASEKQNVTEAALPLSALTILSDEYSESFAEAAQLADERGYEVTMMRGGGTLIGERTPIYFNLDGRQLRRERDRRHDFEGRRRPGNEGCDRNACFDLVFPITVIMPDGTEITGDDGATIRQEVRSWYVDNPGTGEHPELQFPLDIIYEDETTATVNSHEELRAAFAACE
ncbi:MAG: hypothetical protein ACI8YQ_002455 [Polaribacter sp.]|jgi:hypothetical protein